MNDDRLLERISCEAIDKNDPSSYDCVCKVPVGKDIRLIVRIDELPPPSTEPADSSSSLPSPYER